MEATADHLVVAVMWKEVALVTSLVEVQQVAAVVCSLAVILA